MNLQQLLRRCSVPALIACMTALGGPAHASLPTSSGDHAVCKCGGTLSLVLKATDSSWHKVITVPKGANLTLKPAGLASFDGPDDVDALGLLATVASSGAGAVATIFCGDCGTWVALAAKYSMQQAIRRLANEGASMIHDAWGIDVNRAQHDGHNRAGGVVVRIGNDRPGTHRDCLECEVSNVYHLVRTTPVARFGRYAKYHKCITPAQLAAKLKASGGTVYIKVYDVPGRGYRDNSGSYGVCASIE